MRLRIVEDQPVIASLLTRGLEGDWDVLVTTSDFEELFEIEPWQGVDVALVDLRLNGVTGVEVLAYVKTMFPSIRRIAMTGALDEAQAVLGVADLTLVKPFRVADLLEALG